METHSRFDHRRELEKERKGEVEKKKERKAVRAHDSPPSGDKSISAWQLKSPIPAKLACATMRYYLCRDWLSWLELHAATFFHSYSSSSLIKKKETVAIFLKGRMATKKDVFGFIYPPQNIEGPVCFKYKVFNYF